MKTRVCGCLFAFASLGLAACGPSWHPYGHNAANQSERLRADPRFADAKSALGGQDFDQALGLFAELTRSYREAPEALNGLALVFVGQGRKDKAKQMFSTALLADPANMVALTGINRLLNTEAETLTGQSEALAPPGAEEPQKLVTEPEDTMSFDAGEVASEPVQVVILNGSGDLELAADVAVLLAREDVRISGIRPADRFDYAQTTILYPAGMRSQAEQIAALIDMDAELELTQSGARAIEVRIGQNAKAA